MATHSSVLAWRIPGTGEPDGLLSMGLGLTESDTTEVTSAAAAVCDCSIGSGFFSNTSKSFDNIKLKYNYD